MTNPNNAIGTNAAFNGRTSPNALNDITSSFTAGIISGWECQPKTGMTVQLGGQVGTRDVALAEDNAGNKLTINNRSGAPVEVTLSGAPSTNNRVDAIVAYIDNPSTGDDNTTDNPTTCGIIAVSGAVAANPTAPSEATIRSAITTDGATGGTAYYIVLATVLVGTNVTTIGSGVITQGAVAQVAAAQNQAATDAQTSIDEFKSKFNINTSSTQASVSITRGSVTRFPTLSQNSDGSMFKFYGCLQINAFTATNGASVPLTAIPGMTGYKGIATGCYLVTAPDTAYVINGGAYMAQSLQDDSRVVYNEPREIAVGTDGQIYVLASQTTANTEDIASGYFRRYYFPPCLYFNENFGDTPTPQ